MIYAILDEWGGAIKVGYTKNKTAETRLKKLQCGSSQRLEEIGIVEGGFEKEANVHSRCQIHHTKGGKEWIELNRVTIPYLTYIFGFKDPLVKRLYRICEEYQARKNLILG